ncbi:hypothetical protein NE865_06739 [Phthorimaea operculella]|nr:hypothetical protein NE865_06739 [Phthorimaea operculella]
MDAERKLRWRCLNCRQKKTNTAVSDPYMNVTMTRGGSRPDTHENPDSSHDSIVLNDEPIGITADLKKYVADQMSSFTQTLLVKIDSLASSLCKIDSRFDEMELRISKLEKRFDNSEPSKQSSENNAVNDIRVNELAATVDRLTRELNDREQELLLNEIEISGIPESSAENPVHIAAIVSSKLGVQLEERDIVSAARVGVRRDYASAAAAGTAHAASGQRTADGEATSGARVLVVRLQRRAQRDDLLRAARVRRNVDTEGLGLPGPTTRFYVNERLTKFNRQLFRRVRDEKKRLNWRYAWTKDGSILVRRDQDAPVLRVRSEADVIRVFGASNVGGN